MSENEKLAQAYSVRAKCRKGLERLSEVSGAPKGLKLALSKAMAEADAWVNSLRAELYGDDDAEETTETEPDADLVAELAQARAENAKLKAQPTVRKAVKPAVTVINAR